MHILLGGDIYIHILKSDLGLLIADSGTADVNVNELM